MADKNDPLNAITQQFATLITELVKQLTYAAIQAQSQSTPTPSEEGSIDSSQVTRAQILPQTSSIEDEVLDGTDATTEASTYSIPTIDGLAGSETLAAFAQEDAEEIPLEVGPQQDLTDSTLEFDRATDLFADVDLSQVAAVTDANFLDAVSTGADAESLGGFSLDEVESPEMQDPLSEEEQIQADADALFDDLIESSIQSEASAIFDFPPEAFIENRKPKPVPEPEPEPDYRTLSTDEILEHLDAVPASEDVPFETTPARQSVLPFLPDDNPIDEDQDKVKQLFQEMLGVNEEPHLMTLVSTLGQMREQTDLYIERVNHELTQTVDVLGNSTMRVVYLETERERMRSF